VRGQAGPRFSSARAGSSTRCTSSKSSLCVYRLAPAWSLAGSVTRTEFLADAQRSPIVRAAGGTAAVLALGDSF